jgi:Predicted HD superfamily hydrolase
MNKKEQLNLLVAHYANGVKAKFAKMLRISNQNLNIWYTRDYFDIEKVYRACPGISAEWLLTGKGEMLVSKPTQAISPRFNEKKAIHSLAVAKKCAEIAAQRGKDKGFQQQMFLLGWLHDIGYAYDDNANHGKIAVGILQDSRFLHAGPGYRYLNEILMHGYPENKPRRSQDIFGNKLDAPYHSEALDILNTADITTMPNGTDCTAAMRLLDVKNRYGKNSEQYANIFALCKELKLDTK